VPSRAILTVATVTAAALGGGLASAGSAGAATGPSGVQAAAKAAEAAKAVPAGTGKKAENPSKVHPAAPAAGLGPPTAPDDPSPGVLGLEDPLNVGNGWCIAPMRWSGPLASNVVPTAFPACTQYRTNADDGIHVLDDVCLVPVSLDGPLGLDTAGASPCTGNGSGSPDPVTLLRNFSVAGLRTTY